MDTKYTELTRDRAIEEILKDKGLWDEMKDSRLLEAMELAFREGWHRGENFGKIYYKQPP